MTPARWLALQDLVNSALEFDGPERARFVAKSCQGDTELLRQVNSLLDSQAAGDSFIDNVVAGNAQELLASEAIAVGDQLGNYQITGIIGRGGMGTVFRARRTDDQYQQQVAIKILRSSFGMEAEMLVRFRVERQILANLTHPNIARLLDGGVTSSGVPYLVMEYIEGTPIDAFVKNQGLGIEERIRLFRQVCMAVQNAHQNLVVHRDIKPANIIVTADGTPKLLDFGIAKLLGDETLDQTLAFTKPSDRLMTPAYASPEQVRGEPITTASDVYSLGILLYELLTFQRPYDTTGTHPVEAQRRICEDQPQRPSLHNAELKGDLDDIVFMAIRKEPERRYSSAEMFVSDLDRYLTGFPVRAGNGTWSYNTGKFLRRNKLATVAAFAVVLLIAGWIFSVRREQRRTQERFNQVREMAETFLFRFDESIRGITGSINARRLIVAEGLKYLQLLSQDAGRDRRLAEEVAAAYHRIALIQYQTGIPHLGDLTGSIDSLHREEQLLEPLTKADPENTTLRLNLATCYGLLAKNLRLSSSGNKSAQEYRARQTALLEELRRQIPNNPDVQEQLSFSEIVTAEAAERSGNALKALENYRDALSLRQRLLAERHGDIRTAVGVVWCQIFIGDVLGGTASYTLKDTPGALRAYQQAEDLATALQKQEPSKSEPVRLQGAVWQRRITVFDGLNDKVGALAAARRALSIAQDLAKRDEGNKEAQRDRGSGYGNLADLFSSSGKETEAVQAFTQQFRIRQAALLASPSSLPAIEDMAVFETNYADCLIKFHSYTDAESHAKAAVSGWQDMVKRDPETNVYKVYIAMAAKLVGQAQEHLGDCRDAMRSFEQAQLILNDPAQKKNVATSASNLSTELAKEISACQK